MGGRERGELDYRSMIVRARMDRPVCVFCNFIFWPARYVLGAGGGVVGFMGGATVGTTGGECVGAVDDDVLATFSAARCWEPCVAASCCC